MIRQAAAKSFNRITVDGDTSTNDAFIICATGCAGPHPEILAEPIDPDARTARAQLQAGFDRVASGLAERIVRDAEGATRFVVIRVAGGRTEAECRSVAYTLAESPLVKTALFAGDPNWGRLCMAIGRAGIDDLDPGRVNVALGDLKVVQDGMMAPGYEEAEAAEIMARPEVCVNVHLGRGHAVDTVWTSDLSYEYVRINAEYRT